ncbi:MAG: hypothetical protein OEY30_00225 [Candidatus Bathyarchaeota archaeon]|nr:hypothetical protein [Candidatus Bathyarchaeota archaeon]
MKKQRLIDTLRDTLATVGAWAIWGAVCGWLIVPVAALDRIVRRREKEKMSEPVDPDTEQMKDECNMPWVKAWRNAVFKGRKRET